MAGRNPAGSRIGPNLYTTGRLLRDSSPSGEGDPAELVRWNHEQGFDFLKIYSYLSVEDFQTAIREAKKLGMYTAGHIPFAVGLDGVLASETKATLFERNVPAVADNQMIEDFNVQEFACLDNLDGHDASRFREKSFEFGFGGLGREIGYVNLFIHIVAPRISLFAETLGT
jgi:hypothetical protein